MKATEKQKGYMRENYQRNKERISIQRKDYYQNNREKLLIKGNVSGKRYRQKLKLKVLSHYSDGVPECTHCGEADIRVLCMDHMNNDGSKHRKNLKDYEGGKHIHLWLRANNFPEGFQVLCANCNLRKQLEWGGRNAKMVT